MLNKNFSKVSNEFVHDMDEKKKTVPKEKNKRTRRVKDGME